MISCNADSVTRFFSAKGLQVDTERTTRDYTVVVKDHVEDYKCANRHFFLLAVDPPPRLTTFFTVTQNQNTYISL